MFRPIVLALSLATLSAFAQSNSAPIQRSYAQSQGGYGQNQGGAAQSGVRSSEVIPGVLLRTAPNATVETVSANSDRVELRVTRGLANVSVHQPAGHTEILVDLPGGQTAILEDGLYTFNASSDTVRVYKGEAQAFAANGNRSVKLEESYFTTFADTGLRAIEGNNSTSRADILPGVYSDANRGDNRGNEAYRRPYAPGPYGDGFYGGYPYAAYPYPAFGYGYPYGYYGGYPYGYGLGIGLGFGYYGGYGRGYYGGGFGGFRGRR